MDTRNIFSLNQRLLIEENIHCQNVVLYKCVLTDRSIDRLINTTNRIPYLTLPSGWMPAVKSHTVLRPQHGPSAQPRQISRSVEPFGSLGKPQEEEKPVNTTQTIYRMSNVSKNVLLKKH